MPQANRFDLHIMLIHADLIGNALYKSILQVTLKICGVTKHGWQELHLGYH